MSDDQILERVQGLVARSNALTAELLAYLAEVEERKLHLREACGSLFAYCVERLHLSESHAGKRITAARTARRFPVILEMIARGEIHMTGVNLLAPHLTDENHRDLLSRCRHLTKREIEKLIAEIAPRPDVPSRVAAVPRRAARVGELPLLTPAPARPSESHAPERVADLPSPPRALVTPLSPRRYQIRVTVDEDTHARLVQLQDLLAHQVPDRDPAVIIARGLELLLETTLAKKAAVTDRPRASKPPASRTRHIPAKVRRLVWQRDGARCAFVNADGRRCSATGQLEFHHVKNWARGAGHDASEIELRCRGHNQYQAVLDYGAELIAARKRAARPRAEEKGRYFSRWAPCESADAACSGERLVQDRLLKLIQSKTWGSKTESFVGASPATIASCDV